MSDFLKIFPYILGAAVSPILLVTTLYILSQAIKPVKKTAFFLLSATLTIGIVTLFIFFTTNFNPNPAPNKDLLPHLIIGILLLFLAYGIYRKGPAKPKKQTEQKQTWWGYLALGFVLMITNFTTIAMIFEVAIELRADKIIGFAKIMYLLATILSSILPILLPLIILALAGKRSKFILSSLSGFMHKYAHIVTAVFFTILGVFSILKPII
jgi:uncharacterized membrane protein YidH (DUF202 family)